MSPKSLLDEVLQLLFPPLVLLCAKVGDLSILAAFKEDVCPLYSDLHVNDLGELDEVDESISTSKS